jgi:DNA-binding transcriptional ArsR family regulator
MAKRKKQGIDQRLVKAVGHPLRVEVLESIVDAGETSPVQVAKRLDRQVGLVSYHVKVLTQCEVIELVRTRPRRGALEHFFRPTASMREFLTVAKATFG